MKLLGITSFNGLYTGRCNRCGWTFTDVREDEYLCEKRRNYPPRRWFPCPNDDCEKTGVKILLKQQYDLIAHVHESRYKLAEEFELRL